MKFAIILALALSAHAQEFVFVNSTTNYSGSPAFGQQWWAQTYTPITTHFVDGFGVALGTLAPGTLCIVSLNNSINGRPGPIEYSRVTFAVPYSLGLDFLRLLLDQRVLVESGRKYTLVLRAPGATKEFPVSWQTTFAQDIYGGGDLFRSGDGGATWNKMNEPPDSLASGEDGFFYEIIAPCAPRGKSGKCR